MQKQATKYAENTKNAEISILYAKIYAEICKNMDSSSKNMQKYAQNMQKYAKYHDAELCIYMQKYMQKYVKIRTVSQNKHNICNLKYMQ